MKQVYLILISAFILFPMFTKAQDRCAFDEYRAMQQKSGNKATEKAFEKWLREKMPEGRPKTRLRTSGEPLKVPVVVHIIHNGEDLGEGSNLSEEQIYSQIEVINEDFKRLNADTALTPSEFVAVAGSVNLEFVLALRDPDGNPTNGIVRKKGTKTVYTLSDDDLLKSESYWPAEDYLNLWVCDLNANNLGYAQFPDIDLQGLENEPKENRLTDGVVIDFTVFGTSNKGSFENLKVPYDKGRTATHEIGHYFGLLHTFASQGNCLDDDYVEDTPLQSTDYKGCPSHPQSSCSTVDMFQNFMDYTDDACMNLFTMGQVGRMQTVLDFAPRRGSLLDGIGTLPPDVLFYDLTVISINEPSVISCDEEINPRITIQNKGTGTITRLALEYGIDDETFKTDTIAIDSLKSGEQLLLDLESIPVSEGAFEFFVNVQALDDEEISALNNSMTRLFVINRQTETAPYLQKFESQDIIDVSWTVISFDANTTWQIEELGSNGRSAFINLHNYSNIGAQDLLVSPVLDFSGYSGAALKFRVSYGKFVDINENDTTEYFDNLSVLISDNCGNSFTELYNENSDDFKITDTNDYWEPSSNEDWKDFTFDISSYAGSSAVRVAFVTTNGYGNNVFIDDVELFVLPLQDLVEIGENEITLFPNPASENYFKLGFNTTEKQDVSLQIFDLQGKLIQENYLPDILNQVYTIDLHGKRAGVYLVKVKGPTINMVRKLVVNP